MPLSEAIVSVSVWGVDNVWGLVNEKENFVYCGVIGAVGFFGSVH